MKKRGVVVVVLLVLLLLGSFLVIGAKDDVKDTKKITCPDGSKVVDKKECVEKYYAFAISCDNCDKKNAYSADCNLNGQATGGIFGGDISCKWLKDDDPVRFDVDASGNKDKFGGDCNSKIDFLTKKKQSTKGCWAVASEEDYGDDDCAYMQAKPGTFLSGQEYLRLHTQQEKSKLYFGWGHFSDSKNINSFSGTRASKNLLIGDSQGKGGYAWKLSDGNSYICGEDNYWTKCDENVEGIRIFSGPDGVISNAIYECQVDKNNVPKWVMLDDLDIDHDGYSIKDGDKAEVPADLDKEFCPFFKDAEFQGKTKEQLRVAARDLCDKELVKFSTCSICQNPGAKEICGDGVDNDFDPKTSDDCNENAVACRGSNIYEKNFDYQESGVGTGGFCCGFGGIEDLGKTYSNKNGDFLCIKTQEDDLVKGVNVADACVDAGKGAEAKDWCFASASKNKFKVFTIVKPGEVPFDLVSNAQTWAQCGSTVSNLASPNTGPEDKRLANRFACFQEGDQWSWAECYGESKPQNDNLKGRYAGESLFKIDIGGTLKPIKIGDEETSISESVLSGKGGFTIPINGGVYGNYYGSSLEFTGYDYLEFSIKYEGNLNLPAELLLEIIGSDTETPYYSADVLGFAQNGLFDLEKDGGFMHIKVPIQPYRGVERITLTPKRPGNTITIKNMYLSKEGQATSFCSGVDDTFGTNWLSNFDEGDTEGSARNGEILCKSSYGKNAWLGNNAEVDENTPSASCCGNVANEYYAGESLNEFGCWNSQPIKKGEPTMDVAFGVTSQVSETKVEYGFGNAQGTVSASRTFETFSSYQKQEGEKFHPYIGEPSKSDRDILDIYCRFDSALQKSVDCVKFRKKTENDLSLEINQPVQSIGSSQNVGSFIIDKKKILVDKGTFSPIILTNSNPGVLLNFYDPLNGDDLGVEFSLEDLNDDVTTIYVMAQGGSVTIGDPLVTSQTKDVIYPCSDPSGECVFPLPGEAPYTVTNPHPELYELYFVVGSEKNKEFFIGEQKTFDKKANLKVKKVAQQVILDDAFYGCNAADFLVGGDKISTTNNLASCAVKSDAFCAFSSLKNDKKERVSVVNSWSKDEITKIGYSNTADFDLNHPYDLTLTLQTLAGDKVIKAKDRDHSTTAVPARNLVSNALFVPEGSELPYWEILDQDGKLKKSDAQNIGGNSVTLGEGEILRSTRISLAAKQKLHFTNKGTCVAQLSLVDKDGNKESVIPPSFETISLSYLTLQFDGPCQVSEPMLQYGDSKKPADFYYTTEENARARSGAACCSENSCWNGYSCVGEMSELTKFFEPTADDRSYRCIEGEWRNIPPRQDWNQQKGGYCQSETQCFVLAQEDGGDPKNTASSFVEGKYPNCIDNGEYILDNYCSNGVWGSRTNFIATKLLEVAQDDDYTLYCTNYNDTLLSLDGKENQLGGTNLETIKEEVDAAAALVGTTKQKMVRTCFEGITGTEGTRLVTKEENTCINNVCVLKYKDGGDFKTVFATTLNYPLSSPDKSFLLALNAPPGKSDEICKSGEGYVVCDLGKVGVKGELWHDSELNSVIYGKDKISFTLSTFGKIKNWFKGLVGSEISTPSNIFEGFESASDFYSLKMGDKKIVAAKSLVAGNSSLFAQYQNFKTPICDYAQANQINVKGLRVEAIQKAGGENLLTCNEEDSVYRVNASGSADAINSFWPQLTGRLRVE